MKSEETRYPDYPVVKGLQRPLELMLIALTAILSSGISLIIVKQRQGLHSKRIDKGVFVYASSKKM